VSYYLFDGLGSVRQTIKEDGTGLANITYDPSGQQFVGTIPTFGFQGGQYDATTKLYKFGARYDDPAQGRWTQTDPLPGQEQNAATMNRYVYAGIDAINRNDPSGRCVVGLFGSGCDNPVSNAIRDVGDFVTSNCTLGVISLAISAAPILFASGPVTLGVGIPALVGEGISP
jgi:RHS repeat-associated protein